MHTHLPPADDKMLNEDYKDMLRCLSEENVDFLLVGGYAIAAYGFPRATKDIDLFVGADRENASRVWRALAKFGAPLADVTEGDFATEGVIFQIGNEPRRIDLITRIDGIVFAAAYANRRMVQVDDLQIPVISVEDLIKNKRASGRPQDLADVEKLERLGPQG